MDCYDFYRCQFRQPTYSGNSYTTIGERIKKDSDNIIEATWDNDIQSKVCYIYDYFHDEKPYLANKITYDNTTKTVINAKFIITQYSSISKDQVEYHIMFKPSQKVYFDKDDELYYYETDFAERYGATFPIGLYIDIPDDNGIYNKWLICSKEIGNQFIKYSVLPCNYYLMWIEQDGSKRIKRKMWSVIRSQNSYNSGLWTDSTFTTVENQSKVWLPMNSITEKLFYVNYDGNKKNQRIIVSALTPHPITWQISKVENTQPFGLQKLTLYQDFFNPNTDYVNIETKEMFADYYSTDIEPETDNKRLSNINCIITASSDNLKVGGSYRLLTARFYDKDSYDVTENYMSDLSIENWTCSIDGKDFTTDEHIIWVEQSESNQIKIKFSNDKAYLDKILIISCTVGDITGKFSLQLTI